LSLQGVITPFEYYSEIDQLSYDNTKIFKCGFHLMQCKPGQIEFLTENCEGINATLV